MGLLYIHFRSPSSCSLFTGRTRSRRDAGIDMDMKAITSLRTSNNKRRFSDEQIRSLEFMFESEERPESRKKQQLANNLGLQPRQVAIWFQNRRARSKTKQIEHEYNKLKASFETLASSYESLKTENQSLFVQIQKLKSMLEKQHNGNKKPEQDHTDNSDGKSENMNTTTESNGTPNLLLEGYDHKIYVTEEIAVINMEELTESSANWCKFEPGCFPEETSSTSQWWDFWS
ncbi:hypothetical protein Ddye_002965 [Dipteronia dyeriana]|uniref:Homeobox-leucine zipper protein n=1 Tax=Dipteronia dyeriana TaxID=168575 RepID=A0AAE0CUX6_9ROSI|nr:hypothetical protein Ddye_002965 [Dipteronia dyeriana]